MFERCAISSVVATRENTQYIPMFERCAISSVGRATHLH